jgi:hypothetical protein
MIDAARSVHRAELSAESLPSASLTSPHSGNRPEALDVARDLPSDSLRVSQAPAVAHGAAGATDSVGSSTFVIVGGTMLVLLGAAFAAAATNRRPPEAT